MDRRASNEKVGGFGFYGVHIIQSLRPEDQKTGLQLYRFLQLRSEWLEHVSYCEVGSAQQLFEELQRIQETLRRTGQVPLLHVEAHGARQGLQLSSGEFVLWESLKKALTSINMLTKLNLLVVMSACFGESLVTVVRLSERAPVWGCIGPRGTVPAGLVSDGFKAFYLCLGSSLDLRAAVNELGGGMPFDEGPSVLWPSEYFFMKAYERYLSEECTEERLAERFGQIVRQLELMPGGRTAMSEVSRHTLKGELSDHASHFRRSKRIFFMSDLFPENRDRFGIRLK